MNQICGCKEQALISGMKNPMVMSSNVDETGVCDHVTTSLYEQRLGSDGDVDNNGELLLSSADWNQSPREAHLILMGRDVADEPLQKERKASVQMDVHATTAPGTVISSSEDPLDRFYDATSESSDHDKVTRFQEVWCWLWNPNVHSSGCTGSRWC